MIYFLFPETKQKSLEEINQLFERARGEIPEEGNVGEGGGGGDGNEHRERWIYGVPTASLFLSLKLMSVAFSLAGLVGLHK